MPGRKSIGQQDSLSQCYTVSIIHDMHSIHLSPTNFYCAPWPPWTEIWGTKSSINLPINLSVDLEQVLFALWACFLLCTMEDRGRLDHRFLIRAHGWASGTQKHMENCAFFPLDSRSTNLTRSYRGVVTQRNPRT